jgi:hypothetical protein
MILSLKSIPKVTVIYWSTITFLAIVNFGTTFIGFHPHHDGLVFTTIRLLKDSLLHGGEYPFNQYGSFWAMPYLGISLSISDGLLLFSMRVLTMVIYLLTGLLTFKIAKNLYGTGVAKVSLAILILSRPIGLEPIPWPSSIGMFLTVLITFLMVRALKLQNSFARNSLLAIAGAVVVMSTLTRAQIGGLTLLFICVYLLATRMKDLIPFFAGMTAFSILYGSWLASLGWLSDSLWDQFVFGWIVASSGDTDRTFPRISLSILIFLAILSAALQRVPVTSAYRRAYLAFFLITWTAAVFYTAISPSSSQTYLGKFWVAIFLFAIVLFVLNLRVLFKNQEQISLLVGFLGLSNASQIFPLFDPMHAWWGITPLVIPLSKWLVLSLFPILNARLKLYSFIGLSVLMILPYVQGISTQRVYPMNVNDLTLVYSGSTQSKGYETNREFFIREIPRGSRVLNFCVDSDLFFNSNLAINASRYFVYWPTMNDVARIQEEILNSQPDFVLFCNLESASIPQELQEKFTNLPYEKIGSLNSEISLQLYTLSRKEPS